MLGKNVIKLLDDINDLDRIMHLYSEGASKSEETICFWSKSIQALCSDSATFKFRSSELSEKFIYEGFIPSSIENSVAVLRANKEIVDLNFFTTKTFIEIAASSATGWITSFFSTQQTIENSYCSKEMIYVPLLKAIVEIFLEYVLRSHNEDHQLVLYSCQHSIDNKKDMSFSHSVQQAGLFYASQSSETESMTPKQNIKHVREVVHLCLLNIKDCEMHFLEDYMVAKGLAIRSADQQIVKIISNTENSSKQSGISHVRQSIKTIPDRDIVTEQDKVRLNMKSTILQLEKRVIALDAKVNVHKQKALTYKVI